MRRPCVLRKPIAKKNGKNRIGMSDVKKIPQKTAWLLPYPRPSLQLCHTSPLLSACVAPSERKIMAKVWLYMQPVQRRYRSVSSKKRNATFIRTNITVMCFDYTSSENRQWIVMPLYLLGRRYIGNKKERKRRNRWFLCEDGTTAKASALLESCLRKAIS